MTAPVIQPSYPFYLAGRPINANQDLLVLDKFTSQPVASVAVANSAHVEQAIEAACRATTAMQALKPFERQSILQHCVRRFEQLREELAMILCVEAGKPIRDARGEVQRLIETFRIASEEAVRIHGQIINLEVSPRAANYEGYVKRFPIGPCSFISPFNFPLNLVAHKVAPAIAAGCPFVLKPASRTPISALRIGEVLSETDLPSDAFSILPTSRDAGDALITDDRLKLLSFTGSAKVGWDLKARCGKKKVVLELGGNAACIVHADANLKDVIERLLIGAFYQSGQSCISVQRILIHQSIYDSLKSDLVTRVQQLVIGDPKFEATSIGPIISEEEAIRLERWIKTAQQAGGKLLIGGQRAGVMLHPTLMEHVPADVDLCAEEAFGPVAVLSAYEDFSAALQQVNESRYGLQAGVFTNDMRRIMEAWDQLQVGGVVINDVPSWRVDNMPYGGVKDSGLGREGVRSAIEDMTEPRLLVLRRGT